MDLGFREQPARRALALVRAGLVMIAILVGLLSSPAIAMRSDSQAGSVLQQQPSPPPALAPTPDAAAVLTQANAAATRADDVAALAEQAATQASATMGAIQWLIPIFGTLIGLAAVALVAIGFDVRRGARDIQQAYKEQLDEARQAYQQTQQGYQEELAGARQETAAAQTRIAAQLAEIDRLRQAFQQEREQFTAAGQALVLLGLGNRLFLEGKRQQAIETYLEARRLQPDDPEINYRLGRAYSNAGRYEDAISAFERSLNSRPTMPEANMELGLAYRRHADVQPSDPAVRAAEYRLAERYLQRAIDLRPSYEDALGALGGLYRREGRYAEALAQYQRAADVEPNSSYALGNIASLLWYSGETERARYYFERVESVATDRIEAGRELGYWDLYDRALARLVLNRPGALDDHRRAIGMTPSAENLRSTLDNLLLLRRSPTSIAKLEEFIALIEQKLTRLTQEVTR